MRCIANGDGRWSGIAEALGNGRLVDIVADARVLLVHLGVGRGHGLGIVRDGAIIAPDHILLCMRHGMLIAQIADARPGGRE